MSMRAKFDGGKFYNRVQKGAFEHRRQGAGLRRQLGLECHTTALEKITNQEAGPILQAYVANTKANWQNDRTRQQNPAHKCEGRRSKYIHTPSNTTQPDERS